MGHFLPHLCVISILLPSTVQPAQFRNAKPVTKQPEPEDDLGGDGVAPPGEIRKNLLDTISRHAAVVRAYKKVLKVSPLNQAMKDEVSEAIGPLITSWQSLQRKYLTLR
jgi:hypothetical protein